MAVEILQYPTPWGLDHCGSDAFMRKTGPLVRGQGAVMTAANTLAFLLGMAFGATLALGLVWVLSWLYNKGK